MTQRRKQAIAVATASFVLFAGCVFFGWGGPAVTTVVSSVGSVASSVFAFVCAVVASRDGHGRQRLAWLWLSVGLTGWVVGNVVWAYFLLATDAWPPFPSAADAFYLLLPLSTCAAAFFAPSSGGRAGLRVLLDGVVVTAAIFLMAWTLGLQDLYLSGSARGFAFAVAVAYPFADLAMLTMIATVLLKTRPGRRVAPTLLLAGAAVIWATDTVYGYLIPNPSDSREVMVLGWAFAMYLVGLAALHSLPVPTNDAQPRRLPTRLEMWLPYLPVPFAFTFAAVDLWPHTGTGPVVVTGVILAGAVLLRQFTLLSENRHLVDTVAVITLRDGLTGLANRALFADRLEHAMQLRLRNATSVAVLIADLDDFKLVNDSLGHPVGDELLREVGARIQSTVRTGETVARLGGDEFAVLIEDSPEIAGKLAELVARSFDEPFSVDGREMPLRLSIGLASAPADEAGLTADELFNRADLAMYSAKRAHATSAHVFTPAMRLQAVELNLSARTGRHDGVARIHLLADLRRAIDERQLELVYQPKFSLATRTAVGVEALIRWPHPQFGILEPGIFLPMVRENGLMEAVTDLVIARAIEDAAGWYGAGVVLPVSINLSAPSLDGADLPGRIFTTLADNGMPANSFMVEITEDLLMHSIIRARAVLQQLRGFGIRVAIDDFGSGYAAMTYLHELPVDELKLDRKFIAPILHDGRAAAIVRSVIELATTFGLDSVAEGVEDEASVALLKSWGCGFVQGHLFSPPVAARVIRTGPWGSVSTTAQITSPATTPPSWA